MNGKDPRYIEPLCNEDPGITNFILRPNNIKTHGKEPRYNESLYHEEPGITNFILQPNNSKMCGKEPRISNLYVTKTSV